MSIRIYHVTLPTKSKHAISDAVRKGEQDWDAVAGRMLTEFLKGDRFEHRFVHVKDKAVVSPCWGNCGIGCIPFA
jgi:hypothetical protein